MCLYFTQLHHSEGLPFWAVKVILAAVHSAVTWVQFLLINPLLSHKQDCTVNHNHSFLLIDYFNLKIPVLPVVFATRG